MGAMCVEGTSVISGNPVAGSDQANYRILQKNTSEAGWFLDLRTPFLTPKSSF